MNSPSGQAKLSVSLIAGEREREREEGGKRKREGER